MVRYLALVASVLVGGAAADPASPGSAAGRTLIQHDFTTSAQGWRVAQDTGVVDAIFSADGGSPGGYIAGDDEAVGETWYFRAPAAVLQELPAATGGVISFSLKQSAAGAFLDDDIVIVGEAGRLSYRFPSAPGIDWTEFSVRLSEGADWRWNWNALATQAQIRNVLANATRLDIRGEYQTGSDVGGLDNFVLTAGPKE